MPKVPSAETAISLIQTDKSKILDLTVGPHKNVAPGQKIPKAGRWRMWQFLGFARVLTPGVRRCPKPTDSRSQLPIWHVSRCRLGHRRPLSFLRYPRPDLALDPVWSHCGRCFDRPSHSGGREHTVHRQLHRPCSTTSKCTTSVHLLALRTARRLRLQTIRTGRW